jgi:phosphatidylglycerol lysyltransferase
MRVVVSVVAALALFNGVLDLFSAQSTLRTSEMVIGLALVVVSIGLAQRKQSAWLAGVVLSALSMGLELSSGTLDGNLLAPAVLFGLLLSLHGSYRVRSGVPSFKEGGRQIAAAVAAAYAYGAIGFWLLDPAEFHRNFRWDHALQQAFLFLTFGGDPSTVPHTAYARWFLGSLESLGAAVLVLAGLILFRPVAYRLRRRVQEFEDAVALVERYGRSVQDYFKVWPDKSFYFHPTGEAFLAYRVGRRFAIVLGDPVGPRELLPDIVARFEEFCASNGWRVAFHQALPEFLSEYEALGFRRIKVGDEAIVDVRSFSLAGPLRKQLRNTVTKLDRLGVRTEWIDAPLSGEIIAEASAISREWLRLPGNRERQFTLGWFDDDALRQTPLLVARDAQGHMLGFVNVVTSYRPGEVTVDLMRRGFAAPNGLMDYLFVKLIEEAQNRGFERVNLGMAPMAGFQDGEAAGRIERAIHGFFQNHDAGFRFRGLKEWKGKFATGWEPRYAVYRRRVDLPALGLALARVSER